MFDLSTLLKRAPLSCGSPLLVTVEVKGDQSESGSDLSLFTDLTLNMQNLRAMGTNSENFSFDLFPSSYCSRTFWPLGG